MWGSILGVWFDRRDRALLLRGAAFRSWGEIFVDFAVLHYEKHAAHGGDVLERVAVHGNDIGIRAWGDRTDFFFETQGFGGDAGGRHDRCHRILAAIAHAHDEFLFVASVRPGDGVRPVNNFQIFVRERFLEGLYNDGDALLHEGEALLVVVSD